MSTVRCPMCKEHYNPKDFIPSIIRIVKKKLSEVIAPMEEIQQVERDLLEATEAQFDGDIDQHLSSIDGSAFAEDRLMPVSLLLCKGCTENIRYLVGSEIKSVTIPKHLNGRLGITEYEKEHLAKCGVKTEELEASVERTLKEINKTE